MKEDEGKEVIVLRKAGEKVQILFTFPILRFLKKKMKNLKGETIKKIEWWWWRGEKDEVERKKK